MSESTGASLRPLTGWEADAPEDDTILRRFLLSQAAYQRAVGEAIGASVVENERYLAADAGRPAAMVNFALLRQPLQGAALSGALDELSAFFLRDGTSGWVALYSPLPTADLSPWGWRLAGHPRLEVRSPCSPLVETPAFRIERVANAEALAIFERIQIGGFDMADMRELPAGSLFGPTLLDDDRFAAWIAYKDDTPVSGACSFTHDGLVDITMVATLPEARGHGLGRAVTQMAARPELGLPVALFSSDEGRPVYERLGFVPILRGSFWYRER